MKNLIKLPITLAIMMISISMFAQSKLTIQPFEPNKEDGDAIIKLLSGMNKSTYNITVTDASKAKTTYGTLGASDAKLRTSKNVVNSEELRPRIKIIIKTLFEVVDFAHDKANADEIQKIAAKYQK